MVKYLFSNGCSFMHPYKSGTHAGLILAEKHGLEPISYGKCGKGNDRLVVTTKLFFYDNPDRMKDTFVLIGWSNAIRKDYINEQGEWGTWKYTRAFDKGGWPSDYQCLTNIKLKYLREILELQDFFDAHKIPYLMFDALDSRKYKDAGDIVSGLARQVNQDRFFKFDELSQMSFVNREIGKNLKSLPKFSPLDEDVSIVVDNQTVKLSEIPQMTVSKKDRHPNELGDKVWSNLLNDFIQTKKLMPI